MPNRPDQGERTVQGLIIHLIVNYYVIYLQTRLSVDGATRSVQAVKSQASRADVPMPPQLETLLRALVRKHDGKSELPFVNRRERPFSANKLREKQLLAAIGEVRVFHAEASIR